MCARYEQHLPATHRWSQLLRDWPRARKPQFNVKPTQLSGTYDAEGFRERSWWLIPPWSKSAKLKYPTFNARAETLAEKPAFRHAWKQSQRCVVPASCYFEWTGPRGSKQCHRIARSDGQPHLLAGLWEHWQQGTDTVASFTLVTVDAAPAITWLHPRMPRALCDESEADTWLHGAPEEATKLLGPHPVEYAASPIPGPEAR